MVAFRVLLVVLLTTLTVYTGITIANHGFGLLQVFFGDLAAMTWPGQFNLDFMCLLTLSALWLAFRHHFSPVGLVLGVCGFFGGFGFLGLYLLVASITAGGDVKELLLGEARASA